MQKHFVTFLSPGTFFCEESTQPIDSWDPDAAVTMSRAIVERHGATPFAFYFTTRSRNENELDSKEVKRSGKYYLGGRVLTLEQVKSEMPDERILISNMECNGWDKIIINSNSFKCCQPLLEDDVVLEFELK